MGLSWNKLLPLAAFCSLAFTLAPRYAIAETDFKGKSVSMIIGYRAGGSTDVMARLVGPYVVKNLPGAPTLVPRNIPAASGIVALNYFWQQSKPDGLTINAGSGTQIDPLAYRKANAVYDPRKLRIFGGFGRAGTILIVRRDALPRLTDRSKTPLIMAGPNAVRSGMMMTMWGIKLLNWNVKWVLGYRGSADMVLAMQRKEADMTTLATMHEIQSLLASGDYAIVCQSGALDNGKLKARPEYAAPLFNDLVAGKITEDKYSRAFGYWKQLTLPGQWFALPPATPDSIVSLYRKAFEAAEQDAEFKDRIKKVAADTIPMTVADTEGLIRGLSETDNDILGTIQSIQREQGIQRVKKKKKKKKN